MKDQRPSLLQIALTFLLIGTIGFGGGMAIIAMINDSCVRKKKWLNEDEFLHGVTLGQFMGPFAVNTAIFVGYRVRGFWGAVVSTVSFLFPSIIFVIILSELYLRYSNIPSLKTGMSAITPVVVALIIAAAIQLGKDKVKSRESVFLFLGSILLYLLKLQVIWILLLAILYAFLKTRFLKNDRGQNV